MRYSFPWSAILLLAALFGVSLVTLAALAQSSEQPPAKSAPVPQGKADSQEPSNPSSQQPQNEDQTRLFGLAPSHNVGYERNAKTLTSRDKFRIFYQNTVDPFPFAAVAFHAAISQADDTHSGYGHGLSGYGKRYGGGLADSTSARFFCVYMFPSLLKQDPRYLRKSGGSVPSRLAYALSRSLITRSDSGETQFNASNILGKFTTSALANAYYPAQNRGLGATASRVGVSIGYQSLGNLGIEFWPEIRRFVKRL
jgi:hypothetical protein